MSERVAWDQAPIIYTSVSGRDWPETVGQEECVRRGRSIYSLCNSRRTIPVGCPSSVCAKLLLLFQ